MEMKRYMTLLLAAWLLLLPGCGPKEPEHTELYPPQKFSYYYELIPEDGGSEQLIAHISIDRLWDGLYPMDASADSYPYHIVAECTLEKVFYSNRPLQNEGTGHMAREGGTWYLWVELPKGEQGSESMRQLLDTADSFVINGYQTTPYFGPDSEQWERVSMEYPLTDPAPDANLFVEPSVLVMDPITWPLIPVLDGRINADAMKQTVDALYDSGYPMLFSLDETDPENGLYFQNGSTVEELYAALERYVGEYEE